ncbi:MAG: 30S ribosomal protein S5 [Candidatus Falkowbacteria bacterium]
MSETEKQVNAKPATGAPARPGGRSSAAGKGGRKQAPRGKRDEPVDEFEQKIVDLARVTRVMAGGKRMRFRACVAVGNRQGKVGIGLAKGLDVTAAISKAATQAKKAMVDVPIVNDTIPHQIKFKSGAAEVLFKPAARGRGIIAGGAVRMVLELAGIKNITSKTLGTNNKVNNAKCVIEALASLKRPVKKVRMESVKTEAPVIENA